MASFSDIVTLFFFLIFLWLSSFLNKSSFLLAVLRLGLKVRSHQKRNNFFTWPKPMKSQRTDAIFSRAARLGRRGVVNAMWVTRLQRRVFSGAIFAPSWNISALRRSSRNSGQSALEFALVAGSGSLSDTTVTSSVKVTELCEPTGDVMNPNTRALVCGTSTTSIKQN